MNKLSEDEKSALFQMLNSQVFGKAAVLALHEMRQLKSQENTVEGCALAYQYLEGGRSVIDALYGLAEVKKSQTVLPRKLNHIA